MQSRAMIGERSRRRFLKTLSAGGGDLITDGFDSTSEEVAPRWDSYTPNTEIAA